MVLATDMSSHFQQIKAMKNILNHSDNFNADKSKILSLVIHISDISHPAKDWELHSQWTNLLMEEFFRQVSIGFVGLLISVEANYRRSLYLDDVLIHK